MTARRAIFFLLVNLCIAAPCSAAPPTDLTALRAAVEDLTRTFGDRYPNGPAYLARIDGLGGGASRAEVEALRREALLANPLLGFERLIVLKRSRGQLGLPTNHQCNACLKQSGYDNEIDLLAPPHERVANGVSCRSTAGDNMIEHGRHEPNLRQVACFHIDSQQLADLGEAEADAEVGNHGGSQSEGDGPGAGSSQDCSDLAKVKGDEDQPR